MTKEQLAGIQIEQKKRASRINQAVLEELKQETRTFKSFRKTSANLIERHYGDGSKLADQLLGHTQKATKRFYVDSHYDKLFDALDWLREQYDFESCI
jgi:integrase